MVSNDIINRFEKDGAVCIRGAVDNDDIKNLLSNLDLLINDDEDRWTTNRIGGFSDRHLWPTMPWMYDFCAHTKLPEIAGLLMRSRTARLFFDHTFIRDPGTSHATPWHQDQPYWPFQGNQIISAWVALTKSNPFSSGLRFIQGSSQWRKIFQPTAFGKDSASSKFLDESNDYEKMPDFDRKSDEFKIIDWEMEPGDTIFFGAYAVHGSTKNQDKKNRRAAISIRYVGDDARWDPRDGTDPIIDQDKVSINPGDPPFDDKWFPEVWKRESR